jgi:hypothetical protein
VRILSKISMNALLVAVSVIASAAFLGIQHWEQAHNTNIREIFQPAETLHIIAPEPTEIVKNGVPVAVQLSAVGGVSPYHWFLAGGKLPPGIQLDEQSGLLYGTPTGKPGATYAFVIGVIDAKGHVAYLGK